MTNLTLNQQLDQILKEQNTVIEGVWDGRLGNPLLFPECQNYWRGYEIGLRIKKLDRQ